MYLIRKINLIDIINFPSPFTDVEGINLSVNNRHFETAQLLNF
jgi:hypothetical protein